MVIKDYGTIKLELNADVAPISVAHFAEMANKGVYNGSTFHRIIEGFMMQGGAPQGNKKVEMIKGEFLANGIENSSGANPNTVAMAKAPNPTCESPSPIMEFFLRTSDTPINDAHSEIIIPTINALVIKSYENISAILFMMDPPYKFVYWSKICLLFSQRQYFISN